MKNNTLEAAKAAIHTLEAMGYTYLGGQAWKPPLGKPYGQHPDTRRLDFVLCNQATIATNRLGSYLRYNGMQEPQYGNFKTDRDAIDDAMK